MYMAPSMLRPMPSCSAEGSLSPQKVLSPAEGSLYPRFADAARCSGEIKALTARLEADRATQQQLVVQAEAERSAQATDGGREAALELELRAEQRELDGTRFRLLLEHEAALNSVLPEVGEVCLSPACGPR